MHPSIAIIDEYFQLVISIFGTYIDMTSAMNSVLDQFKKEQEYDA
jgi:hypothetical protein